jgi:hypothetical protein
MRSRYIPKELVISPRELVTMVVDNMHRLDLIDLERLLLLSELEISYRQNLGGFKHDE